MEPDVTAWGALRLGEPIDEGNRNPVWRATLDGEPVAVRRSRRSEASLDWELDLIEVLHDAGFRVPTIRPTLDGRRHDEGLVVQRWLAGRPPSADDEWRRVADALVGIHRLTGSTHRQRPGCRAVTALGPTGRSVDADLSALPSEVRDEVLAVFATMTDAPTAVIHGDPDASNIRIDDDGSVGLLDFDESRVDVCWHDLSNLRVQVLDEATHRRAELLSDAWEVANGWVVENAYARRRLASLRAGLGDDDRRR
ncbi:MAG: phosphotransferase [Actinomycetota bacterium]